MKIVCLDAASLYDVENPVWKQLDQYGSVEIFAHVPAKEVTKVASDAEIILTNKVPLDAATINALPNLKYICVMATGYNIIDIEAARKRNIPVSNIPAYSTASVAQQTIALLLAMTNRVETYANENRAGRWPKSTDFTYRLFDTEELAGKYFGVVGFGNTGSHTAAIAAAMGMKILVYTSKLQDQLPSGYEKVELDSLFRRADVVSLHCPLTDSTRSMVNSRRLSMMKPTAWLINTSRGPVVDEQDLAEALREHRIAGAGLDVLSQEPPRHDNELLKLDNCFVTPHVAWATNEARDRLFKIAIGNVKAFVEGHPINVIN